MNALRLDGLWMITEGMAALTHDIRDFWYCAGENLPRYRVLLDF
jgi:hypothetical protein